VPARVFPAECPRPARFAGTVAAEVDRLLSEKLALADIGIVSLRGQGATDAVHHLPSIGRHAFVLADDPAAEERLVADTFLRWKGLERPAIVVADIPAGGLGAFATRMHIALTRALVAVRIVAPPGMGWPGIGPSRA
jgi:hypothetical protein